MKYFCFPMETMNITQNYNGTVSHKPHWYKSKDYADYPIDIAGEGSGQSAVFALCDMQVTGITGIGSGVTNTIWLVTTEKVKTPKGDCKVFMALTHWNDTDSAIKKHNKVGDIVKEGEIICYEGTDGATANHIHLVVGDADKSCGNKLIKNSNGKWVSNGYCMKPEELMYINDEFTKCKSSGGLVFKSIPKEKEFLPEKGYWGYGDNDERISILAEFMYKTFPAYTNKKALGSYFGDNIKASIKEFQRRTNLEADGNVGPITLKKLQSYGFKY